MLITVAFEVDNTVVHCFHGDSLARCQFIARGDVDELLETFHKKMNTVSLE